MEVVVIDSVVWQELNKRLESIENLLQTSIQPPKKQNTILKKADLGWIPLEDVLIELKINKRSWDRNYKNQIKYRKFGVDVWVNRKSLENWLEEKAINV